MRGTPGKSQLVLLAGFGARLLLGLAITAVLGRVLEPADFGFFALVGSVLFAARFLFDLGTGTVAVREIARDPSREKPLLEGLYAWRRACGIGLGLAVFAWAWRDPDPRRRQVLFTIAAALPFLAPGALAPVFTLQQAQEGPARLRILGQLGVLVGALVLHLAGAVGAAFAWLPVGREVWNARGVGRLARARLSFTPEPGLGGRGLGRFLRMALVQGSAMLLLTAIFHVDVFLVRGLRGEAELGAYAAAFRPIQPLLALPALVLLPLVPRLSVAAATKRVAFRGLTTSLWLSTLFPAVACALLAVGLGPFVLGLLYGDAYSSGSLDATGAFAWLGLALGAAIVAGPAAAALMADRKERSLLVVYGIGLAVNVVGNLLLLPRLGFVGAALMTGCTQAGIALVLTLLLFLRGAFGRPLAPADLRAVLLESEDSVARDHQRE